MVKEFAAFIELFRQGKEIANAKKWKEKGIAANIAALLGAGVVIYNGFGHDLKLDNELVQMLSLGIFAGFNIILHIVTSAKVGLPPKRDGSGESGSGFPELGTDEPDNGSGGKDKLPLLMAALCLAGCTTQLQAIGAATDTAMASMRAAEDQNIKLWTANACATPISATVRHPEIVPALRLLCLPTDTSTVLK